MKTLRISSPQSKKCKKKNIITLEKGYIQDKLDNTLLGQ